MTESHFFGNLRKVITLVDRLRDIGLQEYISLPRIAVVGSQSSGKSSLLEQIVGIDFLPRGSGVVTRRPLELRLTYVSPFELDKPYAVFEEIKDKKFFDFSEVKNTIADLTDKIAGKSKGIVDKPILLTIFSSSCPDLTLIDLPGITRIPLKGTDQKEDIEKVTKDMANRYISDPKTIILCVIPANNDISTSDGLQLAKQVDKKGLRTLGVLTKIDIMDRGVNAKSLLLGQEISLKLGYIGVINRSQEDINNNKPVKAHLEDEKKFFSTHPVYSTLAKGLLSTESLTNKLTEVLYTHIRSFLPELQKEMQLQIKAKETRIAQLGPAMPATDKEKMKFLWQIINEFIVQFKTSIAGTYSRENAKRQEIPAGSKIRLILQDLYSDKEDENVCNNYSDDDIKKAILLHEGHSLPGFPSIDAFMALLIPQLKAMREPAQETINEIFMVLDELAHKILNRVCEKVPQLKQEITDSVLRHLMNEREKTREIIDEVIDAEIGYVFTNDVEYLTGKRKQQRLEEEQKDPKKQIQLKSSNPLVKELRNRIDDYFYVVCRGVRDTVPKMIGNFLVRGSCDRMRLILFESVNKSESMFKLMEEPKYIVEERKELQKGLQTLNAAKDMIKKDPDLSVIFNAQILDSENPFKQQSDDSKSSQSKKPDNSRQQDTQKQQDQQRSSTSTASTQQSSQQSGGKKADFWNSVQQEDKQKTNPPPQKQVDTNQMESLFGKGTVPTQKTTANQGQQPKQKPKQDMFGNLVDDGVDSMMANKKVQQGMQDAARQGAYQAIDSKIPIKDSQGNNPLAEKAGKLAEEKIMDEKVQKQISETTKKAVKEEAPKTKGRFW